MTTGEVFEYRCARLPRPGSFLALWPRFYLLMRFSFAIHASASARVRKLVKKLGGPPSETSTSKVPSARGTIVKTIGLLRAIAAPAVRQSCSRAAAVG